MTGPGQRHDALLARLRAGAQARTAPPAPAAAAPGPARADFSGLPAYRPIRLQKAAAAALGLASPYFRLNEGGPGPRTTYDGRPQLSFASYDYLGLNAHPEVRAAAHAAIDAWGVSPSASRPAGGERPWHRALEAELAAVTGVEAAVAMVSGHATNVTTIGTLLGPPDLIVLDALAHNSVSEGARLSGASRLTMPHNDCDWLDATLARVRADHRNVLVAVEGLYSMDGDCPDLARLVEIKARHGAWLMVDEAHALGVLGPTGRGLAEAQGVDPRAVDIWMGTLSKALAACGGYVCGSPGLVDLLRSLAPGFVYSVGMPAPVAETARAALGVLRREPERVARLARNGRRLRAGLRAAGLDTGLSEGHVITPVILGDSLRAVRAAAALADRGVAAIPVIHPAVPERAARLRFFVTSEHSEAEIDGAVAATAAAVAAV